MYIRATLGMALVIVLLLLFRAACAPDPPEPTPEPEPVALLTVQQRVDRVRALQDGPTDTEEEREILELFAGTSGADLRALKAGLDEAMTYRNLVHLAWSDVDDEAIRAELIAHIGAASTEGLEARPLRVLSDIDDTIYCSIHDTRYARGTVYPGVRAFYAELARASGVDVQDSGYVTFITARPGDRGGTVETATLDMLQEMGFERATVLAGTLAGVVSHEAMAAVKLDNLTRYRQVYPEYRFVFVGDSGQGDAAFGRAMLETFPDDVEGVFIHDVVDPEEGKLAVPEAERVEAAETGLYYFDTYPDAARIALKLGLLDESAVARVEQDPGAQPER